MTGYFLERLVRASGQQHSLSNEALKAMPAYDWPGNVRELENCLDRACALTAGPVTQVGDLPGAVTGTSLGIPVTDEGSSRILPMADLEKKTILNTITQLNGDKLLAARMLGIGKTTLYRKLK
ncbi:MAG: hypothetical protein NVS1B11_12200 [Terriglobales bacterium]